MDAPVLVPVTGMVQPASVYQWYEAAVPSVPPDSVSVEVLPEQMVVTVAPMLVGATEFVLTVTTAEEPVVLPQAPSART